MTAPRRYPPELLLALFAPALVLLAPPESHPSGRLLLAALGAVAILLLARRPAVLSADAAGAAAILAPLAAAAVLAAPARARAVDEAALLAVLLALAFIGRAAAGAPGAAEVLAAGLLGIGLVASLVALAQAFWLYPEAAAILRASGAIDARTDAALVRLEAGRPSGPFILPTALAGYLAMTLPAGAAVALRSRGALRAIVLGACAVQVVALLVTRSLGGLVAATVAAAIVLAARLPARRRGAALAGLLLAAIVAGGGILYSRRAEIGSGPGRDPLSLRAGNWRAAVRIAAEHPVLGAGPGDFATAYTAHIRPGMNETRHAHNSWLELIAGWGLWMALPLGLLAAACARRAVAPAGTAAPATVALTAGGAAFLAHNLVDFPLYQPSVAVTGALLVGATFAPGPAPARATGRGLRLVAASAGVLATAALIVHGTRAARSGRALEAARAAAEAGQVEAALDAARRAAAARRDDPDPPALIAEILLAHAGDDAARRIEGRRAADRAVRLDPRSAVRHATRAAWHAAAGETAAAAVELARAHALYPAKPAYRRPEPAP